jgi:hypothetical protein
MKVLASGNWNDGQHIKPSTKEDESRINDIKLKAMNYGNHTFSEFEKPPNSNKIEENAEKVIIQQKEITEKKDKNSSKRDKVEKDEKMDEEDEYQKGKAEKTLRSKSSKTKKVKKHDVDD